MTRFKAAAMGALAITLAAAPVASAFAGGYGNRHYGHHHHYGNPFYPVVGLAAAVVGTAAAIVTLPFAALGAVARAPYYYQPAPQNYNPPQNYYPQQSYYPSQGSAAPGYTAPRAYYPAPSRSSAPPPPTSYSYAPAPRVGQYGDFDGYRGPPPGYAANGGYYPQDARSNGGYYPPQYGAPNGEYASPNQH